MLDSFKKVNIISFSFGYSPQIPLQKNDIYPILSSNMFYIHYLYFDDEFRLISAKKKTQIFV